MMSRWICELQQFCKRIIHFQFHLIENFFFMLKMDLGSFSLFLFPLVSFEILDRKIKF